MAEERINHTYTITKKELVSKFNFEGKIMNVSVYTPIDSKTGRNEYEHQVINVSTEETKEI